MPRTPLELFYVGPYPDEEWCRLFRQVRYNRSWWRCKGQWDAGINAQSADAPMDITGWDATDKFLLRTSLSDRLLPGAYEQARRDLDRRNQELRRTP